MTEIESFLDKYNDSYGDYDDSSYIVDVNTQKREREKMKRATMNSTKTCHHCGKKFYIKYGKISEHPYKEQIKGKLRWFCSWTCLSKNRKERKQAGFKLRLGGRND